MIHITSSDSSDQNQLKDLDISISTIGKTSRDKNNEENPNQLKMPKINTLERKNKYEIIKNTFLSYEPDNNNKFYYQNSFIEIAIFTNELTNNESQLSYHLFKNKLNEIFIFKYDEEKEEKEEEKEEENEEENEEEKEEEKVKNKDECNEEEEKEEKIEENKNNNNNIQNIYKFVCFDKNCNGIGSLAIDLTQSINNNYNYIFNIIKEHSLPYQEHSYFNNIKGNLQIYLNIIKNNQQIKNIQLINVPSDFNDKTCIPLGKDNKLNINSMNLDTYKIYANENDSEEKNVDEYQDENNDIMKKNKKLYKNDKLLSLNIKRHRKPYNVIKQKEYTFVNSKIETLVYAEEKYSRGKDARLENSTSRQNWFSYIHQKFGSRTRLGPHFHRSKKDNKIYKYVIKHLLTGFEDKTLSFYCPLNNCSGKGIMNLENEIFIEVKKHDMSYENHFFRGHQIIEDYYNNHSEITDIQVLRIQSRKDEKEKEK